MQSNSSHAIIAVAGAGKTTRLVRDALSCQSGRVLILTYTNANLDAIRQKLRELTGSIPSHVTVLSWYSFMLRHGVRPYQAALYGKPIRGITWVNGRSALRVPERQVRRHYIGGWGRIYSDKLSKFAVKCEQETGYAVSRRLGQTFSEVYIDEFQDLAGWDIDLVEALLIRGPRVVLVGDPRQHVYSTNQGPRNRHFSGLGLLNKLNHWETQGLCSIEYINDSHRLPDAVCALASAIWPELPALTPMASRMTREEEVSVLRVASDMARQYHESKQAQVLRYSVSTSCEFGQPMNYGESKGLEWDRVLILPNGTISRALERGNVHELPESTRSKLYVAITRARTSVAVALSSECALLPVAWLG